MGIWAYCKLRPLFLGTVSAMALSAGPVLAVTDTVTFTGAVASTCVLTIGSAGVITANAGFTVLSSKNPLGQAGTATIVTTGAGFNLSTSAPGSFTSAPAGGGDNVTFASTYSSTGATTVTDIAGNVLTALGIGTSSISVDLAATKSSGVFVTGNYTATVTVTCE